MAEDLSARLAKCKGERTLDLSGLSLSFVSRRVIDSLSNVKTLNLHRNRLLELPAELSEFSSLRKIDLSRNSLADFPDVLQRLHLEILDLSGNRLSGELSAGTMLLSHLTTLNLSNNRLSKLPQAFGALSSLTNLSLFSLKELNLGSNFLRSLPHDIGALKLLCKLNISNNQLTHLPSSIKLLSSLQSFKVGDNPWISPKPEVMIGGQEAIFKELELLSNVVGVGCYSTICDLSLSTSSGDLPSLEFKIICRDSDDRPRLTGGDKVKVELNGPSLVLGAVVDNKDGTYYVHCTPKVPGVYTLCMTVREQPLPQSGMRVTIAGALDSAISGEMASLQDIPVKAQEALDCFSSSHKSSFHDLLSLLQLSREFNINVPVPEIVVIGSEGYQRLPEAVWGIFPLPLDMQLKRPLILNIIHNEKPAKDPLIILKKDKLLGSTVSGGMRDMEIALTKLPEFLGHRNTVVSNRPISLHVESSTLMNTVVIVAPHLPPLESPIRVEIEDIIYELVRPSNRLVLCVQDTLDWPLLQLSKLRHFALSFDVVQTRTLFVLLRLGDFLQTFSSPQLVAGFFQGVPEKPSVFFASLLPPGIKCDGLNSYKQLLWQAEQRDLRTLQAAQFDTSHGIHIGLSVLRNETLRIVREQYFSHTPRLLQQIQDLHGKGRIALDVLQKRLDLIRSPNLSCYLRRSVSSYALEFVRVFGVLVKGTTLAKPSREGQTLKDELHSLCDENALFEEVVPSSVPHSDERVFGGAQLVRAIERFKELSIRQKFRESVDEKSLRLVLPEGVPAVWAASQVAQRHVQEALVPLIGQLCSRVVHIIGRMTQLAESLQNEAFEKQRAAHCSLYLGKRKEDSELIQLLVQYSYLPKQIKEMFMELVERRVATFKEKCMDDFYRPSNIWDLPALTLEGFDNKKDILSLAESIYEKLANHVCENVAMKFYSLFLQAVTTSVPADMHAALVSMKEQTLRGLFQLQALEEHFLHEKEVKESDLQELEAKKPVVKKLL